MKVPDNIQDLETVLGMVAYIAKFIPRLSDLCEQLRAMKIIVIVIVMHSSNKMYH